jgi:iron-sulfur cluster repair protein YtfE (RIC family)
MAEYLVTSGMTDILDILNTEHAQADDLLSTFETAAPADRKRAFSPLKIMLRGHAAAEESVVYPLFRREADTELTDAMDTSDTQHDALEAAIVAIETGGADAATGGEITALRTAFDTHRTHEENVVFPLVRKNHKLTRNIRSELARLYNETRASEVIG